MNERDWSTATTIGVQGSALLLLLLLLLLSSEYEERLLEDE
jgi:hypothetical protein